MSIEEINWTRLLLGGALVMGGIILLGLSIYLLEISGSVILTAALLGA